MDYLAASFPEALDIGQIRNVWKLYKMYTGDQLLCRY